MRELWAQEDLDLPIVRIVSVNDRRRNGLVISVPLKVVEYANPGGFQVYVIRDRDVVDNPWRNGRENVRKFFVEDLALASVGGFAIGVNLIVKLNFIICAYAVKRVADFFYRKFF